MRRGERFRSRAGGAVTVAAATLLLHGCTLGLEFGAGEPREQDVGDTAAPPDAIVLDLGGDGDSTDVDDERDTSELDLDRDPDASDTVAVADCGNGKHDLLGGELCDDGNAVGGDGCSASCLVEAGFVCGGHRSSCHRPMEDLVLGADLRLGTETRPGRSAPDAVAYPIATRDGLELVLLREPIGIAAGDEVLLFATGGRDAGRYGFATVRAASQQRIELDALPDELLGAFDVGEAWLQRVPHYRNVDVGGFVLSASPLKAGGGRDQEVDGLGIPRAAPFASTGVLALRASGTVLVGDGGRIDASAAGYAGGRAGAFGPMLGARVLTTQQRAGEDGGLGLGAAGGAGSAVGEQSGGGDGESGCGCVDTATRNPGAGGAGGDAPCDLAACCESCPAGRYVVGAGGGGGLPPSFESAADAVLTTPDLDRLGGGAGAAAGGGGGAAAGVALDARERTSPCMPARGGDGNGLPGRGLSCDGLELEPGLDGHAGGSGAPGGGILWVSARTIQVASGGAIVAAGGAGGDGGDGGSTALGAAGGGGAGGQGASGGSIVLDADALVLDVAASPPLHAPGGPGGHGGAGGATGQGEGGAGGEGGRFVRSALPGAPGESGAGAGAGGGGRGGRAGFEGRIILRYNTLNGFSFGDGQLEPGMAEPTATTLQRPAQP